MFAHSMKASKIIIYIAAGQIKSSLDKNKQNMVPELNIIRLTWMTLPLISNTYHEPIFQMPKDSLKDQRLSKTEP